MTKSECFNFRMYDYEKKELINKAATYQLPPQQLMRLAIISYTPTAEDLQRQAALELQERKKEIGIY